MTWEVLFEKNIRMKWGIFTAVSDTLMINDEAVSKKGR